MLPEMLNDFHFIRPLWLLAFIPLVFMIYLLWRNEKSANAWSQMIDTHLLQHLLVAQQKVNQAKIHNGWYFVGAILVILALAGPTVEKRPLPVFETELSKVVLLDLSLSMNATDVEPSRLARAKFKINDILSATKEGQIALIVYAGDAFVISPLTTDAKTIATLVPPLAPELMPVLGSEPAKAFALANQLLANAGIFSGQIIWITDGLDDDDYRETLTFFESSPHQISILAIGTSDGSPIPLADGQGFLKNARGEIVVPSLNYAVLDQLATDTNSAISKLTAGDEDIQYLMNRLIQPSEFIASEDDLEMDTWVELGPWLLLPVLIIISFLFRRGLVFCLVVLLIPHYQSGQVSAQDAPQTPQEAKSDPSLVDRLEWLWLNPDQQGIKAFKNNRHQQAAGLFEDQAWRTASLYRSGEYLAAVDANADASDPTSHYNRGNALAKAGALEEAIKSYEAALEQSPNMEDALFNKKLVEELLKQQQEQQDQQGQDQENQDQQQQNQENQQDQQEQQDSEQQQQEQQNQQQSDQEQQEQQEKELQELEEMTEEERQQVLEQWLRQIKDDPGGLLRRKMYMEYQKRQQQNKQLQQQGEKVW